MSRVGLVAVAFLGLVHVRSFGQSSNVSDAVILVQPFGVHTQIAVTFPNVVPHTRVKDRLNKLAAKTGWMVSDLKISDPEILLGRDPKASTRAGKQTEASALLMNAPQIAQAAFILQPYVETFGDLNRFEIVYLMKPSPEFRGLHEYSDPVVTVKLQSDGGLYRYLVEVHDHTKPVPRLPLNQAVPASPLPTHTPPKVPRRERPMFALVLAFAAGAAFLVLAGWLAFSYMNARRGAQEAARQVTGSGRKASTGK